MTAYRLGVVVFAVLGVQMLVDSVLSLAYIVFDPGALGQMNSILVASWIFGAVIGFAFFFWRRRVSEVLFGPDDSQIGEASMWDLQVVGLGLLGVWLLATLVPELVSRLTYVPDAGVGRLSFGVEEILFGQWMRDAVQLAIGVFLVLRGRVIARLWCAAPVAAAAEEAAQ